MNTNILTKLRLAIAAVLIAIAGAANAIDLVGEDTDLFLTNPNISSEVPNVLIVLDNSANWSSASQGWSTTEISGDPVCGTAGAGFVGDKQGNAELCAIYKVVATLTDSVNVGLMMYNSLTSKSAGGFVRFAMRSMNATNRGLLQASVKAINGTGANDINGNDRKSSSSVGNEELLNDAFRYFNSMDTFGGTRDALADTAAYSSTTKFSFANPSTSSCGYDYIIYIGNGWPSSLDSTSGLDTTMKAAANLLSDTTNVTPNVTPTGAACQGNNCSQGDAWTRFMYTYGAKVAAGTYRHITTYTVDVCKDQCDANQAKILNSMANLSYGRYFKATNLSAIVTALSTIFSQVQAVNSVFAATTLPVSINVRGTNLNQVYIGVFKPDAALSPRWLGNLKQYELGVANTTTGQLQLIDANGTAAVNLNTGFIANTAKSFWTTTSSFWSFRSPFKNTDAGGASDSPDGDLVEKGGAAEQLRVTYPNPDSTSPQTRAIYTCTGTCLTTTGTSLSGTLFNASNAAITSGLLGTFATVNLSSLTASGTTATANATAHGFGAGDQVTIAGAVPSLFNGTFAVATASTNSFTYSLSPNTPDTTHAYITLNTLSSSGVTATTDKVTVTGSTPTDYNVTAAALAAVSGNSNQVSYSMGVLAPTSAAGGYAVTANRRIISLSWDSATRLATVGLANPHNYQTGDSVVMSGIVNPDTTTDTVLNSTGSPPTPFSIVRTGANTFTYSTGASTPSGGTVSTGVATSGAVPSSWSAGTRISLSGVTGGDSGVYNLSGSESGTIGTIASTGTNTFSYNTNGGATTTVSGSFSARKVQASDTNTWTATTVSLTTTGSGSGKVFTVTVTLNQNCRSQANLTNSTTCSTTTSPSEAIAGVIPNAISTTTNITVTGVTCYNKSGNSVSAVTGCSGTFTPTAVSNAGGSATTFTVSYRPSTLQGNSAPSEPAVVTSGTASITGSTTGDAVTVTAIAPGNVTVTRSGTTMYASKTGDLTSYTTSIANQSVATGTITAGLATNADPAERENLIAWVRGLDNKDNENGGTDATDVRASVHGDVLHSRPAVINYNRNGDDNDVFIFYGGNDGMFHAIKGGRATGAGNEQWAFIAQEHFGKLKRLRNQSPPISSTNPRDYFFDGPIGAYTLDYEKDFKLGGTNDKVYLFVGMRRGGRYIYALDVSNPTDPKFLWKKGCPNATGTTGCDAGYEEMGQSWSEPKLGYVNAFSSTLVLMFGAGYDSPVEDLQPCGITAWNATSVTGKTNVVFPNSMTTANCGSNLSGGTSTPKNRTMGRGIYMVNALTGAVLWRAVSPNSSGAADGVSSGMTTKTVSGMDFAIAGDLAVLKNRGNATTRGTAGTESVQTGYLDRIYAVDTGGQVWRVDVSAASATNFVVTKLASIAAASGTSSASMRKFMFSTDVVYSNESTGTLYDAVLVGSGDREHPFDQTVSNRFYMFKDFNVGSLTTALVTSPNTPPATITESNLFDVTNNCLQTASTCNTGAGQTQASAAASLLAAKGWMLQMSSTGEKTIAPATTSAGTVIFNTNEPKQDTVTGTAKNVGPNAGNFCTSDLGTAKQYGLNYQTAVSANIYTALPANFQSTSGRSATFAGGGFLPAPVPVVVSIGGKFYQTVISGVQATNPGGLSLQTRVRTYWYKKTS